MVPRQTKFAFVVPGRHGAMLAELAERPLDDIALLIGGGVEGGRAAASAAPLEPVLRLVRGFGDGRLNLAAAQVRADRGAGSRLIAQDPPGPGPRPSRARPGDLELIHQRDQGQRVVPLPGAGQPGQQPARSRPAGGSCWSARPATGPAPPGSCHSAVPLARTGALSCAWSAAPDPHQPAAGAAPRPTCRAPAPPSHPPRPSTPGPRPDRTRSAADPGSSPRSHRRTSGDAVHQPLPVPEPLRQIPPRVARTGPVEDPVNHQPVIIPPVPLPRMPGQQRLQPRPLIIRQVMPLQPVLIHPAIQAETTHQDLRHTP